VLIGFFMLFTNPLSSQVLARAAHRSGVAQSGSATDQLAVDLAERKRGEEGQ
jgi:multicomponent Na+:H+ antiporter subunit G